MKYMKQVGILSCVLAISEGLHFLLPFPIPASIYGMVLLFLALLSGIIKLSDVEAAANFFVEIMPLTFVPVALKLADDWGILKPFAVKLVIMCLISSMIVFAVSGRVTQYFVRRKKQEGGEHDA